MGGEVSREGCVEGRRWEGCNDEEVEGRNN